MQYENKSSGVFAREQESYYQELLARPPLDILRFPSPNTEYEFTVERLDIDSAEFDKLYKNYKKEDRALDRITDLDSFRRLVPSIVAYKNEDEVAFIEQITFGNGEVLKLDNSKEGIFYAYFPEVDFLLLKGESDADEGYNLRAGENMYEVGTPDYQIISPTCTYRISGFCNVNAEIVYILQDKYSGSFRKIAELRNEEIEPFGTDFFWLSDSTFYYNS